MNTVYRKQTVRTWNEKNVIRVILITNIIFILLVILLLILSKKQEECIREEYIQEKLNNIEEVSFEYSIGYWWINSPEEINDTLLYDFLVKNNAWYPDILVKQARIESGNYTSNLYRLCNNLYGMKKVYKRKNLQNGEYNGYGKYTNWCVATLDRILWDMYTFNGIKPSREVYIEQLSIYAEDTKYTDKYE